MIVFPSPGAKKNPAEGRDIPNFIAAFWYGLGTNFLVKDLDGFGARVNDITGYTHLLETAVTIVLALCGALTLTLEFKQNDDAPWH